MTTKIAAFLRAAIAGLALAFMILPAAPLGGIVPIPTVAVRQERIKPVVMGASESIWPDQTTVSSVMRRQMVGATLTPGTRTRYRSHRDARPVPLQSWPWQVA